MDVLRILSIGHDPLKRIKIVFIKMIIIRKTAMIAIIMVTLCACIKSTSTDTIANKGIEDDIFMVDLIPILKYGETYSYMAGETKIELPVINGAEAYDHGDQTVPGFIPCLEIPKEEEKIVIDNISHIHDRMENLSADLTNCKSNSITIINPEPNVYKLHIASEWSDPDHPGSIILSNRDYSCNIYHILCDNAERVVIDIELTSDGITIKSDDSPLRARVSLTYDGSNKHESDINIDSDETFITFDGNDWVYPDTQM